jgi:hypothetical protein
MSHRPAGGLKSRQVTQRPVRTGAPSRAVRPSGVGQIGVSVGSHVTGAEGGGNETSYRGSKFYGDAARPSFKLGNEIASTTRCGPGGSREVHKSGSQHGLKR